MNMFGHLRRHPFLYACLVFILLCLSSLNNIPYGDDNIFVFNDYVKHIPSILDWWNPHSQYFKSWPLPYTVTSAILKIFHFQALPFRIFNLALHIANGFLFLSFIKLWKPEANRRERFLLFVTFLFHPIALITFNWIFQIKTLLCVFFSLLTLIFLEKAKKKPYHYSPAALTTFFLALTSKIACVLFPIYLVFNWKEQKNKPVAAVLTTAFLALSIFYGLINLKGINSFFKERELSQKPVTEYAQDREKVKGPEEFQPSNYFMVDLKNQLVDSAESLRNQFDEIRDVKLKILLSMFTFGRYVNSGAGINRYAIVYEPNWASLSPGVIISFVFAGFVFLICFSDKKRWKELLLVFIFFIPISGIFYVPYMKYSYLADHWFYPALPFFLSLLILRRPKKLQWLVSGIIVIQFAFLSLDFRSTSQITKKSFDTYKNPFLYAYMIEEAEAQEKYQKAYDMIDAYVRAIGRKNEVSIKTKLRLNLGELKNEQLPDDLRDFLNYSISTGEFETALKFLQNYRGYLGRKEANLYHILITGAAKTAGSGEDALARREFGQAELD